MDTILQIIKWVVIIFFGFVILKWLVMLISMIMEGYSEKGFWGALLGAFAWTVGLIINALLWIWEAAKGFLGLIVLLLIIALLIRVCRGC